MSERFITVTVDEMRFLEIYCNACGNGILLDMDDKTASLPSKCPCCPADRETKMGTELPKDIAKFREFREAMKKFEKRRPQFRLVDE